MYTRQHISIRNLNNCSHQSPRTKKNAAGALRVQGQPWAEETLCFDTCGSPCSHGLWEGMESSAGELLFCSFLRTRAWSWRAISGKSWERGRMWIKYIARKYFKSLKMRKGKENFKKYYSYIWKVTNILKTHAKLGKIDTWAKITNRWLTLETNERKKTASPHY